MKPKDKKKLFEELDHKLFKQKETKTASKEKETEYGQIVIKIGRFSIYREDIVKLPLLLSSLDEYYDTDSFTKEGLLHKNFDFDLDNGHIFGIALKTPSIEARLKLIEFLRRKGIWVLRNPHYKGTLLFVRLGKDDKVEKDLPVNSEILYRTIL